MMLPLTLRACATVATSLVVVLVATSLPGAACAQVQRDPTLPPAAVPASGVAGVSAPQDASTTMAVIVRDGRPYLVVGTRLYAQGQMLGSARIERISETEVWFREGGQLRKVHRFGGVQKRSVAPSDGGF